MNSVKLFLKKAGVFNRLKYSALGDLYISIFSPAKRNEFDRELSFYRSFLPSCKLIFDIGANDGHKTVVFERLGDKIIACDPDPFNIDLLNTRFRNKKNVIVIPMAVTDRIGKADLFIEKPGSALNSINPGWKRILEADRSSRWNEPVKFSDSVLTVATTTLDELIGRYGLPDFIKIDVEGNEKNVLKGLTHPVKHVSFEVLLPEFLSDAMECMDLVCSNNPNTLFNYAVEEKLMLPAFINHTDFQKILPTLSIPHLEIITKTE